MRITSTSDVPDRQRLLNWVALFAALLMDSTRIATRLAVVALGVIGCLDARIGAAQDIRELIIQRQPAAMVQKVGNVSFQHERAPERLVQKLPHPLNIGDSVITSNASSAFLLMLDKSPLRLRELTRLQLQSRPGSPNLTRLFLSSGEIYYVNRSEGARAILFRTPTADGNLKGTEFLLSVLPNGNTEIAMFEGEVELTNAFGHVRVPAGRQGFVEAGQMPRVAAIEAKNLVQWWIYYPGVLDPEELDLSAAEKDRLAASLTAYRAGAVSEALRNYPGYPNPPDPDSEAGRIYYSALLLSVGAVDRARTQLQRVNPDGPLARALNVMIRAVAPPPPGTATTDPNPEFPTATLSSELLARSYSHQATNNLKSALADARAATIHSHDFGFAWARVAELEFSSGHTHAAREAVERALTLTPANAQAHALNGFLLAAENKLGKAMNSFERAIELDSALANGWLGRGLCRIRRGDTEEGRRDLQTAAILEPSRSLLRSYVGKALADAGLTREAFKEFGVARHFDTNDPTPLLYSALLEQQLNRINEAVHSLERSIELNDNRALYRSRLLLDEDRAVRSSSLARIYQDAGMNEVALSEAARAVSDNYANYSSHQFLSESYNALRDPTRFNLRYETPWFNEWLLASLLSPVGGTPLSQQISQNEYSRLFEKDHFGLVSQTEYRSDGQVREVASQFGLQHNTAYSLDVDYQHNDGVRPNNKLDRLEFYATVKQQLTLQDSVLFLAKLQQYHSGDNFQYYNSSSARPDFYFNEYQSPGALLGGYHREWAPGVHTLLLGGRLANDQRLGDLSTTNYLVVRETNGTVVQLPGVPIDVTYRSELEIWTGELNQIFETESHTVVVGGRYQSGDFKTRDKLLLSPSFASNSNFFPNPPAADNVDAAMERISGYAYWTWKVLPRLSLTPGVAYDWLRYPEHFRHPPVQAGENTTDQVSPKAAMVWNPLPEMTVRGAYTRSLGGVSVDESYRLEPVQLAGFSQGFRSVMPEALVGSVSAPQFETAGVGVDLAFKSRTYLTVQGQLLDSTVHRSVGAFEAPLFSFFATPTALRENLDYHELSFATTLNQLVGDEWTFGLRYQFAHAELKRSLPDVPTSVYAGARQLDSGNLHQPGLNALYNHPSGWFTSADLTWYIQDSTVRTGQGSSASTQTIPGEEFPQLNLLVGYRFKRQRGEIAIGALNLTGENYHLNPINLYAELPRERVFYARLRLRF